MGLLDTLLGRTKPVAPDLDALFSLPSAALTLQAATGLAPTGSGSVAVKAAEGGDFAAAKADALALLRFDETATVSESTDTYGYLWLTCQTVSDPTDGLSGLVAGLHGANTTFAGAGFGPALLCSLIGFRGAAEGPPRTAAVVYLYKRGTFYPFAPVGAQKRDSAYELQMRAALDGDLKIEADLARWFPVWDAPGLG